MACLDCGAPGHRHRCPACLRRRRGGSTTERGLGWEHQQATKRAKADATHCSRCGEPFTADNPATGGHVVPRRDGGKVADGIQAQCARCNYGWRRTGT